MKNFLKCIMIAAVCLLGGCGNKNDKTIKIPDVTGSFEFTVLKAGQADAILMQTQNNSIIIDCGEKDDGDDGREEQVTHREVLLVQEVAQGEGDGPSQAPVGDDELVLGGQLHDAELVDEPGQAQHACQGGEARGQTVLDPHAFCSWEIFCLEEASTGKPAQLIHISGPSVQGAPNPSIRELGGSLREVPHLYIL